MLETLFKGHEGWAFMFLYLLGSIIVYMIARKEFRKNVVKYKEEYSSRDAWKSKLINTKHNKLPKYGWDDVFLGLFLAAFSWIVVLVIAIVSSVNAISKSEPAKWM